MNSVVHFEIPYDDAERAQAFYQKVFDWKIQAIPEMNYHTVHTVDIDENNMPKEAGAINGGMYKRDENSSKTPVIVVTVDNLDSSLEKAKEAGATIFREKVQVGDMGFYAQIKDTEGNIIGIWENIKKEN
jgi:uncharacterized protein